MPFSSYSCLPLCNVSEEYRARANEHICYAIYIWIRYDYIVQVYSTTAMLHSTKIILYKTLDEVSFQPQSILNCLEQSGPSLSFLKFCEIFCYLRNLIKKKLVIALGLVKFQGSPFMSINRSSHNKLYVNHWELTPIFLIYIVRKIQIHGIG